MKRILFLGFFLLIFLLTSCGYRVSNTSLYKERQTLGIPFIQGDLDGRLTSSLIRSISSSTGLKYVQSDPDVILKAEITSKVFHTIGYQYDVRDSNEDLINRLVPNEGRWVVKVKLQLIDAYSNEVLHGPFEVEASSDFDFVNFDAFHDLTFVDQAGATRSVLQFSLGQLDAREGATDTALIVAYKNLATKITRGLENL
ncbi:hypothetical protein COB11_02525 [Candidatus Aerophobetes bacterium]|uniref:ABC-type transport auxiliary lipoprotein component domain-containing protein n=1 Tax=Aerophobetes bacterium TaxID=2030807 RepID=A0A2A4YKC5_UNCAE|nr:MAG: hypothetical protein COB11_02525 [Candidatus Aerophobetes bacterium]